MPDMTLKEAVDFFHNDDKAHYIVWTGREFRLGDVNGNYNSIPEGVKLSYLAYRSDRDRPDNSVFRAQFEGRHFTATNENGFWVIK